MDMPNAPRMLPLICYEAIFPGDVAARDDRPGWIINLTNDGWFGISTGPYQHLQQARLRAIEEGLPVVRAANTGISAVIDPMGRIVAQLGLGVEGVLDASLPAAIAPTIYARIGDIPAAIIVAIALIFVILRRVSRAKFLSSANFLFQQWNKFGVGEVPPVDISTDAIRILRAPVRAQSVRCSNRRNRQLLAPSRI